MDEQAIPTGKNHLSTCEGATSIGSGTHARPASGLNQVSESSNAQREKPPFAINGGPDLLVTQFSTVDEGTFTCSVSGHKYINF